MEYIKAPINYVGNKYRILKQLHDLFPKNINLFVDLFSGSGNIVCNTEADRYIANDVNSCLIDIYKTFQDLGIEKSIYYINDIIKEWHLTKENREAYLQFRNSYNKTKYPLDLYIYINVL